ncbi:MAG: molecular chaperone TorD family protein [Thermodesulfobacteriota bacterium]
MTTFNQDLTETEMLESLTAAIMEGLAFVSRVFWGPDLEFCRAIYQDKGLISSIELARLSTIEPFGETVEQLGAVIRSYKDGEALFNDLEALYVSLFISNRTGIAAPLYHSCYGGSEGAMSEPLLMGEPAVEMRKRLASSGLALEEDLNQLPDHLCIEIEYLYFLLKEGWSGKGDTWITEAMAFAADFMLPWVREFQGRLAMTDKAGFYTLAASLLTELLRCIETVDIGYSPFSQNFRGM